MSFDIHLLLKAISSKQLIRVPCRSSNVLTKVGFEVDSIEFEEDSLKGFFIANVEECKKHPESSKLSICKVNTGKEVLQVLCGAPNVRGGINVILATQGAVVPKNGMIIQKTKLAGYESQGMICSADELGAGQNDGSIIELDTSTRKQRRNKFPENPDEFEMPFLFVSGNTVLTDRIDFTANMSLISTDNVDTFDVYINGDYYGSDLQRIEITTNDVLRIEVTKNDNTQEAVVKYENKLV